MAAADGKSVGIIGAGRIGQAMAHIALRAGRSVTISNSRGPESLAPLVAALGDDVAAATADIVVLAVMWADVPKAVEGGEGREHLRGRSARRRSGCRRRQAGDLRLRRRARGQVRGP